MSRHHHYRDGPSTPLTANEVVGIVVVGLVIMAATIALIYFTG